MVIKFKTALAFLVLFFAMFFILSCSTLSALIQPPTVDVKSVKITNLGIKGIDLDVSLQVLNPNSTNLSIDKIKYELSIGDSSLFSGLFNSPVELKSNTTSTVVIPVHLNYETSKSAIENFVFKSIKDYQFNAQLTSGLFTIPIKDKGKISIK